MWGAGLHSRLIDLYLAHTAWVPDSKNDSKIDPKERVRSLRTLKLIVRIISPPSPGVEAGSLVTAHWSGRPLWCPQCLQAQVWSQRREAWPWQGSQEAVLDCDCVWVMRGVGSSEPWSLCLESSKLKYYLATLTPRTLDLVWRLQIIAGYLQNVSDNYRACYLWGAAWV